MNNGIWTPEQQRQQEQTLTIDAAIAPGVIVLRVNGLQCPPSAPEQLLVVLDKLKSAAEQAIALKPKVEANGPVAVG